MKVKIPRVTTIDCETFGIEGRPDYPPEPVGVAIKEFGKKGRYYAFGHVPPAHRAELKKRYAWNNSTREQAIAAVRKAYANPDGVLFHNGKFDLDVLETHFGIAPPRWDRVHETIFLLFLVDPHARQVGLKPAAEKHLGIAPDERDALCDWLLEHQPVDGVRITKATGKGAKHPYGKYIAHAPVEVVGPYALGDVDRTEALFRHLYPLVAAPTTEPDGSIVSESGMLSAYDRERRLVPALLKMERDGIRVDLARLERDVPMYRAAIEKLETWVRKRLCAPLLNLDAGAQLVDALVAAGVADTAKMGLTPTGLVKSDKAAIDAGVTDRQLSSALRYLAQLKTCVGTFLEPWLATARKSGGLIFTNWNQVFGERGGTRSGRFSSTPNFQNMPKEFDPIFAHEEASLPKAERKGLPKAPFALPPLPLCRGYVVPYEDGHVLVGRDYSQQEPRILGHFEGGALMESYQANPWKDYHDDAKDELEKRFGRPFKRKPVKNINLGIIYGQGVPSLAEKNGETVADTKKLLDAIHALYPGLKDMYKDMKRRAKANEPIFTWGGRRYFCEKPIIYGGRFIEFDYKMVNTLVQGSAADCTKEGLLRFVEASGFADVGLDGFSYSRQFAEAEGWSDAFARSIVDVAARCGWRVLLQVHDEIVLSVPREHAELAQEVLRVAMESVEFDVKILSEGAFSDADWAHMVDRDKKGRVVATAPGALRLETFDRPAPTAKRGTRPKIPSPGALRAGRKAAAVMAEAIGA